MLLTSPGAVVVLEYKFTESDGGSCCQTGELAEGPHAGQTQCNGAYRLQRNPVNGLEDRCALTAKKVKYWNWIPGVVGYESERDDEPCPFAGGAYEWMRNVVCAAALAAQEPRRRGSAAVVYVDGPFSIVKKLAEDPWKESVARAGRGDSRLSAVSYQRLLTEAIRACIPADQRILESLTAWVEAKIAEAARARRVAARTPRATRSLVTPG